MKGEEAEKMLERIAAQLGGHFEAVQILVSWNEDGLSMCSKRGAGNWYARIGMAREFLVCDQAQTNANEIKAILPPPDDTEDWKES